MAETRKDTSGNPAHPGADDPSHAPESGEPGETGRQQGRAIDERGEPQGADPAQRDKGGDRDLESGRHGTK